MAFNQAEYDGLANYQEQMCHLNFLKQKRAHGVGVGWRYKNNAFLPELCLRVFVEAKSQTLDELPREQRVEPTYEFNGMTIRTDVYQCPQAVDLARFNPRRRKRPAPGGVSGSVLDESDATLLGTIGGWACDLDTKQPVMLSNAHVFGHVEGREIIQQGMGDLKGKPKERLGAVVRGLERKLDEPNIVDCAIGRPDRLNDVDPKVPGISPAIVATAQGALDMEVEKLGRTTAHTVGKIIHTQWLGNVRTADGVDLPFRDVLLILGNGPDDWSAPGDSGSLVFGRERDSRGIKPVVGLVFAGDGRRGYACKIQNVFRLLRLGELNSSMFDRDSGNFMTTLARRFRALVSRRSSNYQ